MTAAQKLKIVQLAVYSAGETITRDEALSLIAALFAEAPTARLQREALPRLLARLEELRPRPRRRRRRVLDV